VTNEFCWRFTEGGTPISSWSCIVSFGIVEVGGSGGDGGGGGGSGPSGSVDQVKQALQRLLKELDPNCLKYLNSKGIDAVTYINDLLKYAGQGGIAVTDLSPIVTVTDGRSKSGGGTTVIGGTTKVEVQIDNALTGYNNTALTVNGLGAFFNSTYTDPASGYKVPLTVDRGKIKGGTTAAQDFVMLHEVAHGTEVSQHDKGDQQKVDENDKALEKQCKDTIKPFGKGN
jgi:hypothetical protein